MLYTIAVILVLLWLAGLLSSYTMGGADSRSAGNRRCGHLVSSYQRSKKYVTLLRVDMKILRSRLLS